MGRGHGKVDVALALAQWTTGGNHVEEEGGEGGGVEGRRETTTKGMAKEEGGVMDEEGDMATGGVMGRTLVGQHTILPTTSGPKPLTMNKRPT